MADIANNIQALIDFAKQSLAATTIGVEGRTFLVHGQTIASKDITDQLESILPQPRFKKGDFRFGTLADLISFVNEHKIGAAQAGQNTQSGPRVENAQTQAFVSLDKGTVLAVIDGNGPGRYDQTWGHFKAHYEPKFSDQWTAWTSKSGLGTVEFAAFLDERIQDVGLPPVTGKDASDADKRHNELTRLYATIFADRDELMKLSRGIRINVKEKVGVQVNTNSGEMELEYASEHTGANGKLKVPGLFMLTIPVFEGGQVYKLPTRLTYRMEGPTVKWSWTILLRAEAKRTAIADMRDKIKTDSAIPVYFAP